LPFRIPIFGPFGMFYGLLVIYWSWDIFPRFGIFHHEKSGNPESESGKTERKKKKSVCMYVGRLENGCRPK
jgi:hypothetical protein